MLSRVLSLDISASSTGWAFAFGQAESQIHFGLIKTSSKFTHAERLARFRDELIKIMYKFKPSHVVMEDVFSGLNPKTLVLLAKFAGVAQECCKSITGIEPFIIHNNTVRSFFKLKNKEEIFEMIIEIMDWESEELSFKKHNDITDALAQLLCYMDHVLKLRIFRTEQPYGYLYGV